MLEGLNEHVLKLVLERANTFFELWTVRAYYAANITLTKIRGSFGANPKRT
jgi:hypothetical protein